jgi:Protein of unknown function (DUF1549)/Protein of unknown function (DUF1553)/Planctomycete cytochrome C
MRRVVTAALVLVRAGIAAESDADFFEKNVRPLLVAKCQVCHGNSTPMAGLALDSREHILKGGGRGTALVPGQPAASLLIKAVTAVAGTPKMPPSGNLKESEIAVLTEWIQRGAPWGAAGGAASEKAKFWAFEPPVDQAAPVVSSASARWAESPIDRFVLAALEAKGLKPAPPADKRTLLRRATYDLTGLPPTEEEVRAFLADSSAAAFARVIDRLLESPRYGERWGRHWLDVARYADSNGLDENLVYRHAWRYRDYVIQAFNKDKPYDQFVREQIAGDLMPAPPDLATRFERWTATGFLSLGAKMLAEDDPVKMEMDIVDEQLDTAARTFMGLTVGCARCHDHKFDPIPTADYYAMAGIFKSSKTMENFKVVAKWHEYVLAPDDEVKRLHEHEAKIEAKQKEISALHKQHLLVLATEARSKTGAYLMAAGEVLEGSAAKLKPAEGAPRAVREAASFDEGNAPRKLERGVANVPAGQKGPHRATYKIEASAAGDFQLELLEEEAGFGTLDVFVNDVLVKKGGPPVQNRAASPDAGGWSVQGVFALRAGGNLIRLEHKSRFPYFEKLKLTASTLAGGKAPRTTAQVAQQYGVNLGYLGQWVEELERSKGAPHSVLFGWHELGRSWAGWTSPAAKLFEGYQTSSRQRLAERYGEVFAAANSAADNAAHTELKEFLLAKAGVFKEPPDARQYFIGDTQAVLAKLEEERKALETATPDLPRAMGITEGAKVDDLEINIRGSHWSLGKKVPRGFLGALGGASEIGTGESGRLQLAGWMTRPDHPLTSRVMVNRLWRWHFGRGIVPTTDNFGRLGERPSNQALLDWLALEFVRRGWSMKEMHRVMMLSSTYRMSSTYNAAAAETDPENILLWRMPRRRLEVEAIRDGIMAASGGLDLAMGGTVLDYKDRQYVSNTEKRGGANYDLPRRAVYIPVVRSSMYDVFQAFDLPDSSTPSGDRNASVVAPQALFMMNSPVMLTHSRKFAERLLAQPDIDDAARIRNAYEQALARPATGAEVDRALTFIAQMLSARPDRTLAWQSFVKSLLSSSEFIYLN